MAHYAPGTKRVTHKYVTTHCRCGLAMTVKTAWTKENPGKRFISCPKYVSLDLISHDNVMGVLNILSWNFRTRGKSVDFMNFLMMIYLVIIIGSCCLMSMKRSKEGCKGLRCKRTLMF